MVGFISEPSTIKEEENSQVSKARNFKDPIDPFDQKLTNFADSFLDFDSIEEFFENPEKVSLDFEQRMEVEGKGSVVNGSDSVFEEKKGIVDGSDLEGIMKVKEDRVELERGGLLGCSIEEEMGRVSLVAGSSLVVADAGEKVVGNEAEIGNSGLIIGSGSDIGNGSGVNGKEVNGEDESESESDSESESESSSSSSSSSSDDDEEEESDEEEEEEKVEVKMEVNKELNGLGDMEEGEIRDVDGEEMVGGNGSDVQVLEDEEEEEEDAYKMVEWSDVDEDEEDAVMGAPVMSKNELKFLPPVPPVDASLEPHHQMLPVGVVLSAIGPQVIVEGVEKHDPLNEGSILWITEKRSPLGLVDEIFGPVKNPYYVVRYNSESEVPAEIHNGTLISFVPEFANHVLNDKNLHKKGYDASGENDEEVTDEAEFSDDEKEAEYKRMLKMSKRGINDETVGKKKNNRRKGKNRQGGWQNNKPSGEQIPTGVDQLPLNQNLLNKSAVGTSFAPVLQTTGVYAPSIGVWRNVVPSQQPQTLAIPGGFPGNNMPWPAKSQLQHLYQSPTPIQQQFNPGQGPLHNALFPGGQPHFFAGPTCPPPWPAVGGQNYLNQAAFGTGFQVQPNPTPQQGMMSSGPPLGQNCNFQPPAIPPGNIQAPQQFNAGASSIHGRKPYRRGGGRFSGGRGRLPSN